MLLPPAAFLARPFRWLKALSNYRARFTVAPNFAYDLCVDKTDEAQKRSLNLSALDFALNGSEPARTDTLRRFAAAFAASGLRASACAPVYGLAEATLMVSSGSFTPPDKRVQGVDKAALERGTARVAANGLEIASVGPSSRGEHRVAIVDPDSSLQCGEGDVGEIWVHGPSVAGGYWGKTKESIRVFSARLAGANDADTYLRTGDLGFVHSGDLFVTGRLGNT